MPSVKKYKLVTARNKSSLDSWQYKSQQNTLKIRHKLELNCMTKSMI